MSFSGSPSSNTNTNQLAPSNTTMMDQDRYSTSSQQPSSFSTATTTTTTTTSDHNDHGGSLSPPMTPNVQVLTRTMKWAEEHKDEITQEDITVRKQLAKQFMNTTFKQFGAMILSSLFLTVRCRYGKGQFYSPISASFVKVLSTVRPFQPPDSFLYRLGIYYLMGRIMFHNSGQKQEELAFERFSKLQTPFGYHFRS